tara:strand:- start:62 stop:439 length:378 start_codon:yes stop_codon:yes gene_type:complete
LAGYSLIKTLPDLTNSSLLSTFTTIITPILFLFIQLPIKTLGLDPETTLRQSNGTVLLPYGSENRPALLLLIKTVLVVANNLLLCPTEGSRPFPPTPVVQCHAGVDLTVKHLNPIDIVVKIVLVG